MMKKGASLHKYTVDNFLTGKSAHTYALFQHFIEKFNSIGPIELYPTKTMIGIAAPLRKIAWVTALGKDFVHIVFPFTEPHPDNLCFVKIAKVPGHDRQYNHHFRMYAKEDVNEEVFHFMSMAYERNK